MKKPDSRTAGRAGEAAAVRYLQAKGYKILARNFYRAFAEVDIIAQDRDTLVFVEVKARSSARYGSPAEAVTAAKRLRLSKIALEYMMQAGLEQCPARFDVIAVQLDHEGHAVHLEQIENAFETAI